jgi:class 3 adenylate cyclase
VKCGAALALACTQCSAPYEEGDVFCASCGAPLTAQAPSAGAPPATPEHGSERRLVSVLFADLVGFTARSEEQDPEEVRELLSHYFDACRQLIERYGGTVEKFIGDAVMAVWGTPVAQEDDAERAVRAALDLVAAVPDLDERLQARAGVLTGEAAVTIGAEGQGMVAGDLVNTASRIQAEAPPGSVFVGESTRRATEAAIAYDEAGEHELKGKAEPLPLWRALRVLAGRRGEGRAAGLEAPFVGRDREFRLVKDLFHVTADERRATLVSVVGVAGIGKSRLAWEFEKYVDGLVEQVWWHRGRCLSYGEGVAFWALAEMVRMRARISEDEEDASAVRKLREAIDEHVGEPEEREWVEPRLQHLLGLTERSAPDREDLFSAWRLFFERMAERGPVVLLFEDLHWADAGLLEFSEYLLDWSREFPLFVLTLSRPELGERQPTFGMRLRSATSLTLDPLRAAAMDELLDGLVPGLPEDVRTTIRERADGIPLYAVETVRMLLDRGVVTRDGERYRVSAPLEGLQVPETLHALIAARLDGLVPAERRTLQDAAVLGKTFTSAGLAAVSGTAVETFEPLLVALVRKELLAVQTDPRSPERGQFGFLQALVQRVAYETLARRDRKARHLAAAEYLGAQSGLDPDEIAEVIAAHYLDAHRAEPAADDSAAIKSEALGWLRRAGERAASLAATDDARRAFEEAAGLADEPVERARLLERAGDLARAGNKLDHAQAAPARGALPVRGCRRNPRRRARRGGTRHHAVAARAHRGGDRA